MTSWLVRLPLDGLLRGSRGSHLAKWNDFRNVVDICGNDGFPDKDERWRDVRT